MSAGYFEAMGWTVEGRPYSSRTILPMAAASRVVNQEAAERYFAGNAVGAAVIDEVGRRAEIVGVVRSRRRSESCSAGVEPSIYFPMAQDFLRGMTLILAAREVGGPILADLRRRLEVGARPRAGAGDRENARVAVEPVPRWHRRASRPRWSGLGSDGGRARRGGAVRRNDGLGAPSAQGDRVCGSHLARPPGRDRSPGGVGRRCAWRRRARSARHARLDHGGAMASPYHATPRPRRPLGVGGSAAGSDWCRRGCQRCCPPAAH